MEPQEHRFAGALDQMKDPKSIYSFYKDTILLRNQNPTERNDTRQGSFIFDTYLIRVHLTLCNSPPHNYRSTTTL